MLLRFEGGARGMLWCSQVAPGNENALRLRVYGEKGGLEWAQEDPNYLWYTPLGEPKRLLTRGGAGAGPEAARVSRTPGGPSRGLSRGLRQHLRRGGAGDPGEAARASRCRRTCVYPTIEDGVAGVAFVEACVRSSARNGAWVTL